MVSITFREEKRGTVSMTRPELIVAFNMYSWVIAYLHSAASRTYESGKRGCLCNVFLHAVASS